MTKPYSLSLAAVDILSDVLGVSCRLVPFEIPSVGALLEDRVRIAEVVLRDLHGRGLIRGDRVDPDLERAMRLVYDHQVAVAVAGVQENGDKLYARVSAAGDTGVVAVRTGQHMTFELISAPSVPRAAVALLPDVPPGPGQSVMVTAAAPPPPPSPDEPQGFMRAARPARTVADAAQRTAQAMLDRPRKASGFFLVSGTGRRGREVRAGTLSWLDTVDGRYLTLTRPSDDGVVRTTYSPADRNRLAHHLGELLTSVTPRR